MSSTFITNIGTALALNIIFIKLTGYTLLFLLVSAIVIILIDRFSLFILCNKMLSGKVIEAELKFIFLALIVFIFFAELGEGHAGLPAFILGLVMLRHFKEERKTVLVRNRFRTVAYAFVTPTFIAQKWFTPRHEEDIL
jgi:hypothetical protein